MTTTSWNGYPIIDSPTSPLLRRYEIPGTKFQPLLVDNAAGLSLAYFAGWFDTKIETLDVVTSDDHGWGKRPSPKSNHPSGTAIDLNALKHPQFKLNTFTEPQRRKIRARLAAQQIWDWGGDWSAKNRDDMHVEVSEPLESVEVELRRMLKTGQYPLLKAIMKANGLTLAA